MQDIKSLCPISSEMWSTTHGRSHKLLKGSYCYWHQFGYIATQIHFQETWDSAHWKHRLKTTALGRVWWNKASGPRMCSSSTQILKRKPSNRERTTQHWKIVTMALEIRNRVFVRLNAFYFWLVTILVVTLLFSPMPLMRGTAPMSCLGQTGCTGTGLAPAARGKRGQGLPQPRHPAHSLPLKGQFFTCKTSFSSTWPAELNTPQLSPSIRLAATVLVIPLPHRSPFMSLEDRLTKSLAEWMLRPAW